MIELIHQSVFYELTALLIMAAVLGFIGLLLRQPLIVAFIAVGVIAGPAVLGVVQSAEHISLLAELGIAVLLFLVGLKLDVKLIRTLGAVSLTTGLGQVIFTSVIGFFIALALGMNAMTALYVAIALTFSSTIIIVKLLSDKKEVDSLHGGIALGFLIVQDLVVVLAMMVLSAFGVGASDGSGAEQNNGSLLRIATIVLHGLLMLVLVGVFIRYIANPLVSRIAHSPELLASFAIGWAALLAAAGDYLGFSKELGGLLAGVSLASTHYREAIVSRLASLRDFLLLFFFIALGAQLDLRLLGTQLWPALLLSAFVLIGNPLIVMIIMGLMGYRKRTGFLAGLTVAQISEFSLIFVAMGMSLGHVGADALGLVTLVGLVTIAMSVYMITYSHSLYAWLEPYLAVFERRIPYREQTADSNRDEDDSYDVILFGLGRYGSAVAHHLQTHHKKVLAVDFNPETVRRWRELGHTAIYGDACDAEFIGTLPLTRTAWIIAAMPHYDTGVTHEDARMTLLEALAFYRYQGKIAVTSYRHDNTASLKAKGATLVLQPFHDAAEQVVKRIDEAAP